MKENLITIKTGQKGSPIGDLFGIFLEDLNHAADGGLYAEMVQNRSFEFSGTDHPSYHSLTAWERIGQEQEVTLDVREGEAVSEKNPHYLRVEISGRSREAGVRNTGFEGGMHFQKGKKYLFSCYVRCPETVGHTLCVSLRNAADLEIAHKEFTVKAASWDKIECEFMAGETAAGGSLALVITKGNSMEFDFVSLFPQETFRGRRNGLRLDLAEALEELKPRFVRFPGGCLVHDGSLDENARDSLYRWKNTVGPLEERPARRNNWRYNQTLGLGYYEYFLFCEDISAKPVPILPAAYDPHHKRAVPLDELEPWIQETLDLIEFANGDETTKWGSVRAGLGHREPFGLEYLGIGNEEVGEGFRERFPYFVKAVRRKYPEIKIVGISGPFCGGGEYEMGWECARQSGADIVDEHYYMAPEWFISNVHRYDSFGGESPYVFVGEYAAGSNSGKSALAEAAYMTALQNDCHAVKMACYAPLLCHREYENWKPDMVWFDNDKVCRSVNYEVQKLFMNHQGDELVSCELQTDMENEELITLEARKQGDIYFWGDEARVLFTEIELYDEDTGESIFLPDTEVMADKIPVLLKENAPQNIRLKFHALEIEGFKGFRVYFAWKNEKNRMYWVFGGWENQDAALVEEIDGKGCFLSQNQFHVEKEREYALELHMSGSRLEGWIDGELFQSVTLMPMEMEPIYLTASRDRAASDLILKVVNLKNEPFETGIKLQDVEGTEYQCDVYLLLEENCAEHSDFPGVETAEVNQETKTVELNGSDKKFMWRFPERSVTILRLKNNMI